MKPRRITSKQVAARAGVSQTTVSFVLNQVRNSNISEETRQRVFEAARELNYVPDVAAQALARGRSNNLAMILVNPHRQVFADPYIPNIITGFNQVAKAQGFRILLERIDQADEPSHVALIAQLLRGGEVAGAVISGCTPALEDEVQRLAQEGYPLVFLDVPALADSIPFVTIDHVAGVQAVIQHLINLGHQRIGCITYAPMADSHVTKRLAAYRETLERSGILYDEELVRLGAYDPESGRLAARSLMEQPHPPTAIFGMNDLMALGALAAIHERGWRIPQDIAVVGYDDMRFSPFTHPPLTTVHAPEIELGEHAGMLLFNLLSRKPRKLSSHLMMPQLVIRSSCGAAP